MRLLWANAPYLENLRRIQILETPRCAKSVPYCTANLGSHVRPIAHLEEPKMTKRRWLKSIIATSQDAVPAMPFQRGNRRKPSTLKTAPSQQTSTRTTGLR
jgi:hypothetical protein